MSWLPILVAGFGTAMIIAVMGLGVVLVYRTSGVLAFHVGEVGVLAAYTMTSVWQSVGGGLGLGLGLAAIIAVGIAAGLLAFLLVEVLGSPFGHFTGTVVTIALAISMAGLISLLWEGHAYRLPVFAGSLAIAAATVPLSGIAVAVIGAALAALLIIGVAHTGIGLEMRAVAGSSKLASLRGVPVRRTLCLVWLGASVLAALAGTLLAMVSVASPEGSAIGVSAIVAAILGGLTSMWGCIVGAILLAAIETGVTVFFEPRYAHVVPVLLLLALLAFRPSGLAGRTEQIARV